MTGRMRTNGGPAHGLEVALDTLTIHPSPAARIAGMAAWARSSGACTLSSKSNRRRFSDRSATSPYIAAAALLTRMSIGPPSRSAAVSTTRDRASGSDRSTGTSATGTP